jgi:CO dehydrogenase/acetyl-CoA synthase beta subunit
MDIFDDTIKEIKTWSQEIQDEVKARRYEGPAPVKKSATSSTLKRKHLNPTIILKEDTHLELGHPSVGSCSAALATRDSSLIENGLITLIGPDVPEMEEPRNPFAQIALAYCQGDVKDISQSMDRQLHRSAQSDEYMIRSVPHLIWARVSKEAAASGFSLFDLGRRLLKGLWSECEGVTGAEIIFVTTSREHVSVVEDIVKVARAKLQKILSFEMKDDDTYECTAVNDCEECPEQVVCDNIRDVIKLRKGDRIISFGREAGRESG